jgi:hypothetical protein
MLKKFNIVLLALFFLCLTSFYGTQDIAASLSKIPDQDRRYLDQFFQYPLRKSPMGYTLFGNKPISLFEYPNLKSSVNCDLRLSLYMEKGWKTWTRHEPFFPSKNFVLKKEKEAGAFHTNTIILINKTQVLSAISQNLDLFTLKLGKEFQPKEFLKQICYTEKPLFEFLKEEDLIGILLGFGRVNGVLFNREHEIAGYLQTKFTPPFSCLEEINQLSSKNQKYVRLHSQSEFSKRASPSSSFRSLGEEFNAIINKRGSFEMPGNDEFLNLIGSPHFVDYGEDAALINSYVKTRRIIRETYEKAPFLEATLIQWTNSQISGKTK